MSTRRTITSREYPARKDADGRPLCRWCGETVKPPKRSWCSKACVHEYMIRSNAKYLARHVMKRDHGVCARCGRDVERLRQRYRKAFQRARDRAWQRHLSSSCYPSLRRVNQVILQMGFPADYCRHWWEAHHIRAVVEGGGECGLENFETLCCACHKRETAELARRRANQRRAEKQQRPLGWAPEATLSLEFPG